MCDIDFKQCKAQGHLNGGRISMYIDRHDYDVLEWIAEETINLDDVEFRSELYGTDGEQDDEIEGEEDEEDHTLAGDCPMEHEIDEDKITTKTSHDDPFLNVLVTNTNDEGKSANNMFPSHNPLVDWKEMKPVCGMRFQDKEQLRNLLTNYSVAHGYDLYFETNDKFRVVVRCGRQKKRRKRLSISIVGIVDVQRTNFAD